MPRVVGQTYNAVAINSVRDRDAILALWQRNFQLNGTQRFAWLYEQAATRGFILRSSAEEDVGAVGCLPRLFRCNGTEVLGGQAIDLNVDMNHRTVGPALKLQRTITAEVDSGRLQLIYGFPNSASEGVLKHVGYRNVGRFQRWVKLLSTRSQFSRRVRSAWVAAGAATLTDAGLRFSSLETYVRAARDVSIELIDRFDNRFDELQQRAPMAQDLIGDRSASYLNWRLAAAPGGKNLALTLSDRDGRLQAYVAFRRVGRAVSIADFLYAEVGSWRALMAEFIRRMRREQAEQIAVGFLGPSEPINVLRKFGFWARPSTWSVMLYANNWQEVTHAGWLDPNRWWLTRADVDTDENDPLIAASPTGGQST